MVLLQNKTKANISMEQKATENLAVEKKFQVKLSFKGLNYSL